MCEEALIDFWPTFRLDIFDYASQKDRIPEEYFLHIDHGSLHLKSVVAQWE